MRLHIVSLLVYLTLSQNATTEKPTQTNIPTAKPTKKPTYSPTMPRYTSKVCVGPEEGSDMQSPVFTKEFCGHMEYFSGTKPRVDISVT